MKKKGWSNIAIAGLLGNIQQESNFRVGAAETIAVMMEAHIFLEVAFDFANGPILMEIQMEEEHSCSNMPQEKERA